MTATPTLLSQQDAYARLLVRVGLNIQQGQTMVIVTPIECAPFARQIQVEAYRAGAGEVVFRWLDDLSDRITFDMAADGVFDTFPEWMQSFYNGYARKDAAFLRISSADPEVMKGVDPGRMARSHKARSVALEEYRNRQMANLNTWCVASVPSPAWARKVFPALDEAAAMEALWRAILSAVRADTPDPVAAWDDHQKALSRRVDILNTYQFTSLHYTSPAGTDLRVDMPADHVWIGGGDPCAAGYLFMANIPTEEIFSAPHAGRVNGRLVATKPLVYHGTLIEDFWFQFTDGVVTDYDAWAGKEVLATLLDADAGARRLGEIALVPHDSPISNQGILYYDTLFDENASCHFALGKAYPVCVTGGTDLDKAALASRGINDSLVHEDFMVGSADLDITGTLADGTEVAVFRKGNFAF